ncbi:MAG: class II fumarate hydratase [Candidatus Aminicenantes bacterium]|nr:class II fumarate hydratase [Candidatus Aminicenantes bacterium]
MADKKKDYRVEKDSLGELRIPAQALWGVQTQRAVDNFHISGLRLPREFIRALGLIKQAAAETNLSLGLLDKKIAETVIQAAGEVVDGQWDNQFPVDVFQTGSGTSTNMNANEVIANRANEILGRPLGSKTPVHPNDHVNMGQSSNDVIPSCIHIAGVETIKKGLLPVLQDFRSQLEQKAGEFAAIVKLGRTHLQDATPVRLGQEFGGYAAMVGYGIERIEACLDRLSELALGGTAVGTGLNSHPEFARLAAVRLSEKTGLAFREAENHFEAQGSRDAVVHTSGALKTLSVSLIKIANDIRWLGSGPYGGIGEILIPAVQPGSSIMPGKINPVMAESLIQVAAQVTGCDAAITLGGLSGNFELNVMLPFMAYNFLFSIKLLEKGVEAFTRKCISGLKADKKRCRELVDKSLAMVTALAPVIGYDRAAEIAKEAYRTGKPLQEVIIGEKILSPEEVEKVLDPEKMT